MSTDDEIRDSQRDTWDRLSASWEKWDSIIMDQLGPITAAMIEWLDIAEDQQHLDIATGTGEPGLSIATRAPKGRVVLSDLAPEMLGVATRRAHAQGLVNIETRVCGADDLPFPNATFDSVAVRLGYMFFPDPAAATAELARVLAPGGRVCAAVWGPREDNPWTTIVSDSIATEVGAAPPDPARPSIFRCAAPGLIGSLFADAGLCDVLERDVAVELTTASPEEYWAVMSEHVAPVTAALLQVDKPTRDRIRAAAMERVRGFERDGHIRVPGMARCIRGVMV